MEDKEEVLLHDERSRYNRDGTGEREVGKAPYLSAHAAWPFVSMLSR